MLETAMNLAKYIGLTYKDLNCWELVQAIMEERDIILPDPPLTQEQMEQWRHVEIGQETLFDVLLFRHGDEKHVGVCIGNQEMIHSDEINGVCVERYTSATWKDQLIRIYRHR